MARPRWAALAVLATITLAACTGGGKAKTTAQGQVAATGARSSEALSKALDITVPAGYVRQPDTVDDTGPSDLEKAIADDGEDDARDVFTRDHFVRGYQREWAQSENEQIISYVYQFADNAGAVDYSKRVTSDSGAQTDGMSVTLFDMAGIAGAVGVNGSDPSFATSSVTFVKDPYTVQMVVNSTSPAGLQALVTSLAEEQYSRL